MDVWTFLIELTGLLALCAVLGTLSERLGFSALIGYLLAGLLLGPGGLGVIAVESVQPVAELGVALLLFSIGLEFSLPRLRRLGGKILLGGILQVVVTGAAFSALALALGLAVRQAIVVGAVLCLSSTASVLRLLQERTELETVHGRSALGILLVQDVAVIPLVLLVTLLGGDGGFERLALDVAVALGSGAALVGALLLAGRYVLPRFLTAAVLTRNRELAILTAVVICLATTWAAHAVKLSPALGAFVAGIVLAESPFATQIRADVGTLRTLFVALFFAAVGMLAELGGFARNVVWLPVILGAILLLKALLILVLLRLLRLSLRHAIAAGVALSQVGEFGFVLLQISSGYQLLPERVHELLLLAIFGALLLTPWLLPLGPRIGAALERRIGRSGAPPPTPAGAGEQRHHVIVVGFGPAGQQVAEGLQEAAIDVLVIDANPKAADLAAPRGIPVLVGDATYGEILEHAHLASARALAITIPDHDGARAILRLARARAPHVPVVVRARYRRFAREFSDDGAARVYDEEGSAGRSLASLVTECARACPTSDAG